MNSFQEDGMNKLPSLFVDWNCCIKQVRWALENRYAGHEKQVRELASLLWVVVALPISYYTLVYIIVYKWPQ